MTVQLTYKRSGGPIPFSELGDNEFFFSNRVLFRKLAEKDLRTFAIKNVNAVNLINGGLAFFEEQEIVFRGKPVMDGQGLLFE